MSSPESNQPPPGVRKRRYRLVINNTSNSLIQRIVHLIDLGAGSRVMRAAMVGMFMVTLCVWYDICDFKNFSTMEAMDSAQLARNIAEGRGYTTDFVRPLSIFLVQRWNEAAGAGTPAGANPDFARLQTRHPDLANPPLYPLFLAGLMKVLPFRYAVESKATFWSEAGSFARYEPDFLIALANQLLLAVAVWQTFWIARKLFDAEVAWVSAALVLGCELLWEFSISGLSTLLIIVIFLGLTRVLLAYEEQGRAAAPARNRLFGLAMASGALVAGGALTRYSFGWLILPVAMFLVLFGGEERWRQALSACGAFGLLLAGWVLRNYLVSGTPFGTATFAVVETTSLLPAFQLERSLHPDFTVMKLIVPYLHKLWSNLGDILQNDLPRIGRSWVTPLFFAGLLMRFRGLPVRRARYFLLMCLATLAVCQAMGRTHISVQSPVVNSENLLVLALPLMLVYGAAFFFTFRHQIKLPQMVPEQTAENLRYAAMVAFVGVMSLPMLGALFSGRADPVAFPPYYPPDIQKAAKWMKPTELMMSDVPWAVAWYGDRQCLWLTLNTQDDFFALSDYIKPIRAVYLTPETLDLKITSECLHTPPNSWGNFVLKAAEGADTGFPLKNSPGAGSIASGLFLTDRPRWLDAAP